MRIFINIVPEKKRKHTYTHTHTHPPRVPNSYAYVVVHRSGFQLYFTSVKQTSRNCETKQLRVIFETDCLVRATKIHAERSSYSRRVSGEQASEENSGR